MTEHVLAENHDGVLVITLNRPEKKNAITNAMWARIHEVFREGSEDDSVVCALLCGAGENFCSGVDLGGFSEEGADPQALFNAAALAVAEFDKPLVAAVQGASVGGGATVLFHADIVYAADTLRMRLPFASLGLAPEWASSYMLQANIGAQRAAELFYTAEWIDADKAHKQGIVADVLAAEELYDHAMSKAREIAQWPVNSLREIKRSLRMHHQPAIQAAMQAEQEAMARQAGSPENIEAITAFMEKRAPNFRAL